MKATEPSWKIKHCWLIRTGWTVTLKRTGTTGTTETNPIGDGRGAAYGRRR